jgi:uncharacterized membrane protein
VAAIEQRERLDGGAMPLKSDRDANLLTAVLTSDQAVAANPLGMAP